MSEQEKKEISKEIVEEWYLEKGVSEKKPERRESQEKEVPPPQFTPSYKRDSDEKKEEEENKKLLVKREIKHLLALAEEKGLQHSIKEAQKKNDPFLLDIYHDVLAKDAAYKNFIKR